MWELVVVTISDADVARSESCSRMRDLFACRLKWQSGQPFAGQFDAAPTTTNATQFLRIDGNQLVINCKRCACMPSDFSILLVCCHLGWACGARCCCCCCSWC